MKHKENHYCWYSLIIASYFNALMSRNDLYLSLAESILNDSSEARHHLLNVSEVKAFCAVTGQMDCFIIFNLHNIAVRSTNVMGRQQQSWHTTLMKPNNYIQLIHTSLRLSIAVLWERSAVY